MKIALFGRNFNDSFNNVISGLFEKFRQNNVTVWAFEPFYQYLQQEKRIPLDIDGSYTTHLELPADTELMISIGGDGTFLEAITIIRSSGIPIVGINSGRLGFLANISSIEVNRAFENLLHKNYSIEERSLVHLTSKEMLFNDFPYALNEFTLQKTGSSLITIQVTINNEYMTAYWSDGLIIATPTGSTAYSLSLGGPIVTPDSKNFIITPIAAHNLNVRPLIIPDDATLKFTVSGRSDHFFATLDSRSATFQMNNEVIISKADFNVRIIRLPDIDFFTTLRNKLMWGADRRN
ncbi:MAG TPA: NAD kinase [Bacteroidales bacterium]|nr:NAD kinase [Bacteroidales bacterium]